MLDLRRLAVFREVAARRSFSGAALALSYTQSTVSQAVAELERELGVTLLDRSSRPVRVTPAGEVVLDHAATLLEQADAIRQELAELSQGETGRLRVAAFMTAWTTFVPDAVAAFTAAHPRIDLEVEQLEPAAALRKLRTGDLDVAVIYRFPGPADDAEPDERLVALHLFDDPYRLVLPAGHRLAKRKTVRLEDLAEERWVLPPAGTPYTEAVRDLCRRAGADPITRYETSEVALAQPLVAAGLAIALVPAMILERPHPGVVIRDIGATARSVWAVRPARRRVPAAQAMVGALSVAARTAYGP